MSQITREANLARHHWDKIEYLHWIETRGEIAGWNREHCKKADQHIRSLTLMNFYRWADSNVKELNVREFMKLMVRVHFGSAEVDALMVHLECYPDWM